jgi:ADP-ribosylglycohydrolase
VTFAGADEDPGAGDRARLALEGLSLGDSFGERFFIGDERARVLVAQREVPAGTWRWTDDTAMAACVVNELLAHGTIDADRLATSFARRYVAEPARGYGRGAREALAAIARGVPWSDAARLSFRDGSRGNGAAMRSAPIGAFFGGDVARVTREATASALPTHVHPDAIDGAVAVALAAGYAATRSDQHQPAALLGFVAANLRDGVVAEGIRLALDMTDAAPVRVARTLGAGERVLAEDTVPFALWCADRHLGSLTEALWTSVGALGDRDTTCAIVGGIVAGAATFDGLPRDWLSRREPLPRIG